MHPHYKDMKRYIVGILIAFMPIATMLAQEEGVTFVKDSKVVVNTALEPNETTPTDSTLSKRELRRLQVAKRNLHYNILGGPSYTPDFGVLVGGSALMTFRIDRRAHV